MLRAAVGLIIAVLFSCVAAHAEDRRVALVIGNSTYKYAGKLPNPVNDAADVANALKRLGFQVTLEKDLEWESLARSVDNFLNMARGADVAIFFYAGHGLQHDGGAFILPVDARLENEFSLKRETFSAQEIVSQLGASTHASIVLLDACRNNPLAEKLRGATMSGSRAVNVGRGLGRIEVGGNSLVVYSAAPGQEARDGLGRNSPFTEALLKHMETPGLEVEQMLKRVTAEVNQVTGGRQQPERLSQLKIEVTLRPGAAVVAAPAPPAAAAAPVNYTPPRDEEAEKQKAEQQKREAEARKKEEEARKKREDELRVREESLKKRIEMIENSQKQINKKTEQLDKKAEELDRAKHELEQTKKDRQDNSDDHRRTDRPQHKEAHNPSPQNFDFPAPANNRRPVSQPEPERAAPPAPKPVKQHKPSNRDMEPAPKPAPRPIENYSPPPSRPSGGDGGARATTSPPAP